VPLDDIILSAARDKICRATARRAARSAYASACHVTRYCHAACAMRYAMPFDARHDAMSPYDIATLPRADDTPLR